MTVKKYIQFDLQGNQLTITSLLESQVQEDNSYLYKEITDAEFDTSKTYKLNLEDNSLIDLSTTKELGKLIPEKSKEIEDFYEEKRKLKIVKDSDYLIINCDQRWFDNLINIRSYMEDVSEKNSLDKTTLFYDYRVGINGQERTIRLYYNTVRDLMILVSKNRSYCRINLDYHLRKVKEVTTIEELGGYNYGVDTGGNTVENMNDFIL